MVGFESAQQLSRAVRSRRTFAPRAFAQSRLHASLKRNYQLMPALKWLRMLTNHISDKHEHFVRYYGHYSNRSRGAKRLVENGNEPAGSIRIDRPPADNRRKANRSRPIPKVYKVDPLKCAR